MQRLQCPAPVEGGRCVNPAVGKSALCELHSPKCRALYKQYKRTCNLVDIITPCSLTDLDKMNLEELRTFANTLTRIYGLFKNCYNARLVHSENCYVPECRNLGHYRQFQILSELYSRCENVLEEVYRRINELEEKNKPKPKTITTRSPIKTPLAPIRSKTVSSPSRKVAFSGQRKQSTVEEMELIQQMKLNSHDELISLITGKLTNLLGDINNIDNITTIFNTLNYYLQRFQYFSNPLNLNINNVIDIFNNIPDDNLTGFYHYLQNTREPLLVTTFLGYSTWLETIKPQANKDQIIKSLIKIRTQDAGPEKEQIINNILFEARRLVENLNISRNKENITLILLRIVEQLIDYYIPLLYRSFKELYPSFDYTGLLRLFLDQTQLLIILSELQNNVTVTRVGNFYYRGYYLEQSF